MVTTVVDADNLMKLLAEPTEIVDSASAKELVGVQGAIDFDNVITAHS